MRLIIGCTTIVFFAVLLAGCARYPTTTTPGTEPTRTLYCEMTVNNQGQIDPDDYYFLAIGVDQSDSTGPVPVITGPELTNGWGTITGLPAGQVEEPPFYVMVHGDSFAQYLGSTYLGAPFQYGTKDDKKTIWVEIDQSQIDPLLVGVSDPIIQLNWITMQSITAPLDQQKQYDGFGRSAIIICIRYHCMSPAFLPAVTSRDLPTTNRPTAPMKRRPLTRTSTSPPGVSK